VAFQEDSISIIITGGVANVSIGYALSISSNTDNTLYQQTVSVLVSDTNGIAVPGAVVSLGLRPSMFATGYWLKVGGEWELVFDNSCDGEDYPGTLPNEFVNEDLNNNASIDGVEDQLTGYYAYYSSGDMVPGLGNIMLTPGQAAAGTIPATVITDDFGVANFTLTYQKEYAAWVQDQITATTSVFGTEYITTSNKWLAISAGEVEAIANAFPTSPFNSLPCGTVP